MFHRDEHGRIWFWATVRYTIARAFPFWERFFRRGAFAPGRAMTSRERARWSAWTLGGEWRGPKSE